MSRSKSMRLVELHELLDLRRWPVVSRRSRDGHLDRLHRQACRVYFTKLVGKYVDLRVDQRKSAATSFLRLHDALVRLEAVASEFLTAVEPVLTGQQPRLYRVPFDSLASAGDAASRAFADSLRQLYPVIRINDPSLAALLRGIRSVKEGVLITVATSRMTFAVLPNPESVFAVHYSAPTDRLMAADLQDSYEIAEAFWSARARKVCSAGSGPRMYSFRSSEDNFVEERLSDSDIAQMRHLREMVAKYVPFLVKAREQVEAFLRSNVSLEDLLYVHRKK